MLHHCHSWWLGWGRGKKDGDEFKARIHEQSKLEATVNALMFIILSTQGLLVLVSDIMYLMNSDGYSNLGYLFPPQLFLPDRHGEEHAREVR